MIAVIDRRGRLFGLVNVIDAAVALLLGVIILRSASFAGRLVMAWLYEPKINLVTGKSIAPRDTDRRIVIMGRNLNDVHEVLIGDRHAHVLGPITFRDLGRVIEHPERIVDPVMHGSDGLLVKAPVDLAPGRYRVTARNPYGSSVTPDAAVEVWGRSEAVRVVALCRVRPRAAYLARMDVKRPLPKPPDQARVLPVAYTLLSRLPDGSGEIGAVLVDADQMIDAGHTVLVMADGRWAHPGGLITVPPGDRIGEFITDAVVVATTDSPLRPGHATP